MSFRHPIPKEKQSTPCPQCHALMLSEMRFCRQCGYRLGEGSPEYTETVRLNSNLKTPLPREHAPLGVHNSGAPRAAAAQLPKSKSCLPRRLPFVWVSVGVLALLMLVAGSFFQSSDFGATSHQSSPAPRTYLGAADLEDAEGDSGAFVSAVSPAGGPLDVAGLIGGDVIKEFDGKPIADEDDLTTLLENIPEAKAATLTFSRDGETLQATVTTASEEEIERLRDAADNRAEGKGYLGMDDLERVKIPGTENYGVKIGEVKKNRPADIAGLQDGDIVRQFNDVQIRTEDEFRMRCERAAPASTVSLTVIRNGETLVIPVKMGER